MRDLPFTTPTQLRNLLGEYGLRLTKKWGQHFLVDRHVLERMVHVVDPQPGQLIMEVGAGAGVLTAALASQGPEVVAVEVDRGLEPVLRRILQESGVEGSVRVVMGDALAMDWRELLGRRDCIFVANLPYNISSPVLERVLTWGLFRRAVVMLQKDVAHRMIAVPGSKQYGSLSLFVRYYGCLQLEFDVKPTSFFPRPKVESSVVSIDLTRGPRVQVDDPQLMFDLIRSAFGYRRKQLVNALARCQRLLDMGWSRESIRGLLGELGWERARGEDLNLESFGILADEIVRRSSP